MANESGVRTPNITESATLDYILGSKGQSTRKQPVDRLAQQLLASGPLRAALPTSGSNTLYFATKAEMLAADIDAVVVQKNLVSAWVYADQLVENNGVYRPTAGTPIVWTRVLDLPLQWTIAEQTVDTSANAIIAKTGIPVSRSVIVALPIAAANTGVATVSFNGGAALTIVSNSGNAVVAGGLLPGMLVWGNPDNAAGKFRLLNDQVSSAIVAAAEQRAAAAEASSLISKAKALISKLYAQNFVDVPVESATNLMLRSEEIDNAAWVKTNITVSANAIAAPDGLGSAEKLVETAVNAEHALTYNGQTVIAGQPYTQSVFVKAGERTKFRNRLSTNIGFLGDVYYDLSAGVILATSQSIINAEIEDWGNGWFRCSATAIAPAGATTANGGKFYVLYDNGSTGTVSYLGEAGKGLYLWGAQLENNASKMGPYVATTTASAGGAFYSAYHWAMKAAQSVAVAVQSSIIGATAKTTLSDGDKLALTDSAASDALKSVTFVNFIASIFTATRFIANGNFLSSFRIRDAATTTKQLAFNVASIAAATTRTITMPDRNVDLANVPTSPPFVSDDTSFVIGTMITMPHGRAAIPDGVDITLVNVTAEYGYTAGMRANPSYNDRSNNDGSNVNFGFWLWWDATNVYLVPGPNGVFVRHLTSGGPVSVTAANWRLKVRAV